MSTSLGAGRARKVRNKQRDNINTPPPAAIRGGPARQKAEAPPIETEAMTSAGPRELSQTEALAYSLHRAALADRLTLLAAVDDEAVLVAVQALLVADDAPTLAAEVEERIAVLRRGRADAAGVPREDAAERPVVLRPKSMRWLPVPLSPEDHQAARLAYVAHGRRLADAKEAEALRSASAKAAIKQIEAELAKALERADRGTEPGEVEVEERITGRLVETVRLDTGEVIDQRRATDAEVEDASQVPLWGRR